MVSDCFGWALYPVLFRFLRMPISADSLILTYQRSSQIRFLRRNIPRGSTGFPSASARLPATLVARADSTLQPIRSRLFLASFILTSLETHAVGQNVRTIIEESKTIGEWVVEAGRRGLEAAM